MSLSLVLLKGFPEPGIGIRENRLTLYFGETTIHSNMKTLKLLGVSVLASIICSCGGGGADKPDGPITPTVVSVTSVSLSKTSAELTIGNTLQLMATVSPSNATDKTVTWSSSSTTVASVSPTGLVTAIAEGSSNITASCGGKSATCKITVVKPTVAVTSVELDQTDITLKKGDSQTLKATVKPDNATDKNVTWTSSKTDVATVDNAGKVTAVAKGAATITASCSGKTATCKVTVSVPVESVSLYQPTLTLKEGDTQTLVATVKPDDASNKTVEWTSSKTTIATVDDNGKVTAVAEGTATITASCEGKSATCEVTVSKAYVSVTSVTLSQTSASLKVNETVTLTATVKPDNATDKTVTWSTSDGSVATVSNGVVTAKKIGTATITAKSGDKSATCAITVVATPVTSVTLSQTSASLKVNETVTLTATVKPDDATDKTVTWSTSDGSVATVSNGVVTAKKIGTATITAKSGDKSATCAITVVATPVTSVTLSQTSASLKVNETVTLTATVKPDDATDKTVTWSTSDGSVATVSNGVVTAKKIGTATITAKAGDKSATCAITVVANPDAGGSEGVGEEDLAPILFP